MPTLTKGNVVVENIKIGDIHYEFSLGMGLEVKVISLPSRDENGYWTWKSEGVKSGRIIDYGVSEGHAHYGPNLYDYKAYNVNTGI